MAKPIVIRFAGSESSFGHAKLDRARLYGHRRRVPLDQQGRTCVKAALTTDGLYLLQSGMTAQGYFDEQGRWLQRNELVGLSADGSPLELQPSTLGVAKEAVPVDAAAVLRYAISAVYVLEPLSVDVGLSDRLQAGEILSFGFNYGADYHEETAFLLVNPEGFFCLVGSPLIPSWSEPGRIASVEQTDDSTADDLDFEMF